ncbi:hypothetical protein KR018_010782, partial [Drosophila ironensis]
SFSFESCSRMFRKIQTPKVSAVILLGFFYYAKLLGVVFFRSRKTSSGLWKMRCRRPLWKWMALLCQLILLAFYTYNYIMWISDRNDLLDQMQNYKTMLLQIWCFLGLIGVQLSHGSEVILLVNGFMKIFRRARVLSAEKKTGFGGGRELFLILLTLCCQCHEYVFYSETLLWASSLWDILDWFSYVYVVIVSHIIMRINLFWYLSVGVLYSELNKVVRLDMENLKNPRANPRENLKRLKECLMLYQELSSLTSSFQDIFNLHLFLTLIQIFFDVSVYSYDMIQFMNFHDIWRWCFFMKIILDLLILSVAIHGAVSNFQAIRELYFEMSGFGDAQDWQKTVEVFLTYLNQFELRVTILGLFDVSMEFYLEIASGIVTYLIFVIQTVLQLENE